MTAQDLTHVPDKDKTYKLGPLDMDQVGELTRLLEEKALIPIATLCNCGQCGRIHHSDCAVHNEPAYQRGACDCIKEEEKPPCEGCGGQGWYEGMEPDPRDPTGQTPMQVQIQCPCEGR